MHPSERECTVRPLGADESHYIGRIDEGAAFNSEGIHRRSQGVAVGAPAPPRAVKKCVSAPPGHEVHLPARTSQILGPFLLRGLNFEVDLDSVLGRQLFWQKSVPPDKIRHGYDYGGISWSKKADD